MELKEYQKRIAYQIYPASFKDSNNDGWGDLQGIISELDYLKDLGVGMIWLSPIYDSPMDDMGYDISDYKAINPRFGTMEDFDELMKKANELDIKIVMDLVINHTSTEHPWFKAACKDRDSKYRYYYIIEKGTKHKCPNNWDSCFSGPAWKKMPGEKDKYFMHLFCDTQADLNYKNHVVVDEIKDIIKFWLDKGVYGFRCDVINCLYKSSLENDKKTKLYGKGDKFYFNQDGFFDVMKEIREDVLDNYDTFLLGETSHIDPELGRKFVKDRILDTFFEFDHLHSYQKSLPVFKRKFSPKILMTELKKWQENSDWMSNYLENHDQLRSISCLGDESHPFESGSLLATLLMSLRGTPFIYQGEEIGIMNDKKVTRENTNDISAKTVQKVLRKTIPFISKNKAFKMVNQTINRDHARKPMMFDDSINGGFNEGHDTWIPVNEQYKTTNIKAQLEDPNSLLSFYKSLINFRKNSDVLTKGDVKFEYISDDVNTFIREYNGKMYYIILNFSNKIKTCKTTRNLNLLFSNYKFNVSLSALKPYYAGIYEVLKEGETPTYTFETIDEEVYKKEEAEKAKALAEAEKAKLEAEKAKLEEEKAREAEANKEAEVEAETATEEVKEEAPVEVENVDEIAIEEEPKVDENQESNEAQNEAQNEVQNDEEKVEELDVQKPQNIDEENFSLEPQNEDVETPIEEAKIEEETEEETVKTEDREELVAPTPFIVEKDVEPIKVKIEIPEGNLKAPTKEEDKEPEGVAEEKVEEVIEPVKNEVTETYESEESSSTLEEETKEEVKE